MVTVICISFLISKYNDMIVYANDTRQNCIKEYTSLQLQNFSNIGKTDVTPNILHGSEKIEDNLGRNYLKIKKPNSDYYKINLEDLYETHSIKLTISNLYEYYFDKNAVQFVKEDAKKSLVENVDLTYKKSTIEQSYDAVFNITLDTIYVYDIYENDEYIYINLVNPHDVYNKIIVIDAGHGGDDVGTYTPDMKYFEKNINLDIVLQLKKLLDKNNNIKVYYTRTTDKKVYLNPRINIANYLKADYFISIHCNSNRDSRPNGTEVLYKKSKKLAAVCLDNLVNETGSKRLGIIKDNNIHIIKKSKVPIALIEVAFMSNNKDLNYLIKEKNQKKIAQGIYNAISELYNNEK